MTGENRLENWRSGLEGLDQRGWTEESRLEFRGWGGWNGNGGLRRYTGEEGEES
jgi:hypothetical protein